MDSNSNNLYKKHNYPTNGMNTYSQYPQNNRLNNQYGSNMNHNYGMGTAVNNMNSNQIYQKPRTSNQNTRPFSKEEWNDAKEALKSLKMKMGNRPKREITTTMPQQGPPNPNNQMNRRLDPNYGKANPLYNNNRMGGFNSQPQPMSNDDDEDIYSGNRPKYGVNQPRQEFGNMPKTTTANKNMNQMERIGYGNENGNYRVNKINNNNNYQKGNYDNMHKKNNYENNNYKQSNYDMNNYNQSNYENNNYKQSNSNNNVNEDRELDKGNRWNEVNANLNPSEGEPTYPCPDCGKKFVSAAYEKHARICKKVFQNKRKAFDVKGQRVLDSEHANLMKQGAVEEKKLEKIKNIKAKQVPKWKKQSDELRKIARINEDGSQMGGPAQYTPSTITDDYIFCNFCNRKYNQNAYDKHKDGCERRFKDAQIKQRDKISSRQGKQQNNYSNNNNNNNTNNNNKRFGKK